MAAPTETSTTDPQVASLTERVDELLREVKEQRDQFQRLVRAYAVDAEQLDLIRSIADLWDVPSIAAHVHEVATAAPMLTDPFPHIVMEPLLPEKAFQALLDAVPPEDFFEGERHLDWRGVGHHATIAPLFSRTVWSSLRRSIIGPVLAPILAARFRPFAREFLRISMGDALVDEVLALPLTSHGLRLMIRRPGWNLAPHLDPRDQFISTLLYLARPGEPEGYGTQLFRVHKENFVPTWKNTYYPEAEGLRCELAKTMPYRGNLCLSFLNLGGGAHGADLPADAQPPDLRRLVFQFYMGPNRQALETLVERLPPDLQLAWTRRVKKKDQKTSMKD